MILIHNYTCIFVNVHLLCIYYIFTLYLVYKLTTFFTHMFFCYFSDMLFIINTVTIDMVGIYYGYIDVAWWKICLPLW